MKIHEVFICFNPTEGKQKLKIGTVNSFEEKSGKIGEVKTSKCKTVRLTGHTGWRQNFATAGFH